MNETDTWEEDLHIDSSGFVSVNLQKSFQHLQHSIFGIAWNDFIGGFFSFFSCCVYCIAFSGRLNHGNVIQVISESNRFFWGNSQLTAYFFQCCSFPTSGITISTQYFPEVKNSNFPFHLSSTSSLQIFSAL